MLTYLKSAGAPSSGLECFKLKVYGNFLNSSQLKKKYLILNTYMQKCFCGVLAVMLKFGLALRCPFGFCSECNIYVSIALLCTIRDSRFSLRHCGIAGTVTTAMVNVGVSCNSGMVSSFKSHLSFSQLLIVT